jgi:hypothetical protein
MFWLWEICCDEQVCLSSRHMQGEITHCKQQFQDRITLLRLQPHDALGESWIHGQHFLSCHRMYSHDRMIALDWFPPHKAAVSSCIVCLWKSTMFSFQPFQEHLQWLRQSVIRRRLARPCRITTSLWHLQQRQKRDTKGLILVRHTRVVPVVVSFAALRPGRYKLSLSR